MTADDAISMLSQHLITRPVFDALFGGDDFTQANPVSQVMQAMLDTLDEANIDAETATLDGFYEHIRMLVGGIDTAEGRQKVITELYEKFFKKVVPKTASSLGIVYTPVEIVDFINRAVNDLLARALRRRITVRRRRPRPRPVHRHRHVHRPPDPVRADLTRRPATQVRTASCTPTRSCCSPTTSPRSTSRPPTAERSDDAGAEPDSYEPFPGIVLTDTFQMTEDDDSMDTVFFPRNNERADRQKNLDIRVIVGNPPYSVGPDPPERRQRQPQVPDPRRQHRADLRRAIQREVEDEAV